MNRSSKNFVWVDTSTLNALKTLGDTTHLRLSAIIRNMTIKAYEDTLLLTWDCQTARQNFLHIYPGGEVPSATQPNPNAALCKGEDL